jgi:hypothetical protein
MAFLLSQLDQQVFQAASLEEELQQLYGTHSSVVAAASAAASTAASYQAALSEKDTQLTTLQLRLAHLEELQLTNPRLDLSEGVPGEEPSAEVTFGESQESLDDANSAIIDSGRLSSDLARATAQLQDRDAEVKAAFKAAEEREARMEALQAELTKMSKTHADEMIKIKEKLSNKYRDRLQAKKDKHDAKMALQKDQYETRVAMLIEELHAARDHVALATKEAADAMVHHNAASTIQRSYRHRTAAHDLRAVVQASSAKVAALRAKIDASKSEQVSATRVEYRTTQVEHNDDCQSSSRVDDQLRQMHEATEREMKQLQDAHLIEIQALRSSASKREALNESRYTRKVEQLQQLVEELKAASEQQTTTAQQEQHIEDLTAAQRFEVRKLEHRVSVSMGQLASARKELADVQATVTASGDGLPALTDDTATYVLAMKRAFAKKHADVVVSLEELHHAAICKEKEAREAAEASCARVQAELIRLRREPAPEDPKLPPTAPGVDREIGVGVVDAVPASAWEPPSRSSVSSPDGTCNLFDGGSMDRLTLAIRTGPGTYTRLSAGSNERICEVKMQAATLLGVPATAECRLSTGYRVLDDSLTLAQCGIKDKAVVRLEVNSNSSRTNVILRTLKAGGGNTGRDD